MSWVKATWKKGKKTITGKWFWHWSSQRFLIQLDGKDDLGMDREMFPVAGEEPEFCGWKLVENKKNKPSQR